MNDKRKKEHLSISLNEDISYKKISPGFEDYKFVHQALPEVDLNEIDLTAHVFGKKLRLPLMILPLVGGIESAGKINMDLARVAQEAGIAMGVGSQRIMLENNISRSLSKTFEVRKAAPDILLFSNIGAVQLNYGFGIKQCREAVETIGADGLILHLNSMQEAFQYEGNCNFVNLLIKIKNICDELKHPVILKEVGFGISAESALKLISAHVSGIDVGGAGGTSWVEIEKLRAESRIAKKVAESFKDWGIPTAESIVMVRDAVNGSNLKNFIIIASGGIRDGLEVAKSIALGADIAGIGLPLLKKINISVKACIDYIKEIELGLRIAMFGIGADSISKLKNTEFLKERKFYRSSRRET